MDWLSLETPIVGTKQKIVTFWRSRSFENAFPRQFHDKKMSLRFASNVLLWLRSYTISSIFQIPKSGEYIVLRNKSGIPD